MKCPAPAVAARTPRTAMMMHTLIRSRWVEQTLPETLLTIDRVDIIPPYTFEELGAITPIAMRIASAPPNGPPGGLISRSMDGLLGASAPMAAPRAISHTHEMIVAR